MNRKIGTLIILTVGALSFIYLRLKVRDLSVKAPLEIEDEGDLKEEEQESKQPGLVAHLSFDEGERFDGVDDYVEINAEDLKKVGEIKYGTISLRFKFNKIGARNFLPMLSLGEISRTGAISTLLIEIGHFDHNAPSDTKLYYTIYNDTSEPVLCFDSNEDLKENTWYHFVVVNSPSGNIGYLNGAELTDRHYNFGAASDTQFFTDLKAKESFRLGYGYFGIDQEFHYFKGIIDEVKIYNRVLTAEEIKAL